MVDAMLKVGNSALATFAKRDHSHLMSFQECCRDYRVVVKARTEPLQTI